MSYLRCHEGVVFLLVPVGELGADLENAVLESERLHLSTGGGVRARARACTRLVVNVSGVCVMYSGRICNVWLCGCVVVWLCGCVGVWV